MDKKNNYCVIMAGGVGSRFWPLSRSTKPKQFLDILGTGKSLIQQTKERVERLCPTENIYIVTNKDYLDVIKNQMPDLADDQILLEPNRRNTAPCIAYASYKIAKKNPGANIIVAPSDHIITKEDEFTRIVSQGLEHTASNNTLLTLGIKPSRPDTGYGYIQIEAGSNTVANNMYKVKTFTEKPDLEMAKFFVKSGEFYWNSGIFIWSVQTIIKAFGKHLPDINKQFSSGIDFYGTEKETQFINDVYSSCQNISIDYGVMEKADNVNVICADIGWSDLGTWGSLYDNLEKDKEHNAIIGENVMTYNTSNSVVNLKGKKLAVLEGMDGYIVVESDDLLLICRKENEQDIRKIVNDVKMEKGDKYV